MLYLELLSIALMSAPTPQDPAGGPEAESAREVQTTYSRDIAPVFQKHCQDCHRPGEVAPMSLLTYEDVRPWARSIKKAVKSREMPPWHADPEFGSFGNDPRLSEKTIQTIVRWVDAGAPEGDPNDHPPPREFTSAWRLGTPDLVFSMPAEFQVKAEGEIPYKYFTVPTHFEEDKWVRAVEVRPGNPEVVHHIIVFIREPRGEGRKRGRDIWQSHLSGIAPGEAPDLFPPGTGKRIPRGSSLIFQVHYTPSGKETTDRSKVGLFLSEDEGRKPLRHVHTRAAMNRWLTIPPGAADYEAESRYTFRKDALILSVMPHMHLRGKSFRYDLLFPDGTTQTICSVPRWDFNWQHSYVFSEPIRVARGTVVHCRAAYDNSAQNRVNPDPTKLVRWGDQTWDEMMIGFVAFVEADEGALASEDSGEEDEGAEAEDASGP